MATLPYREVVSFSGPEKRDQSICMAGLRTYRQEISPTHRRFPEFPPVLPGDFRSRLPLRDSSGLSPDSLFTSSAGLNRNHTNSSISIKYYIMYPRSHYTSTSWTRPIHFGPRGTIFPTPHGQSVNMPLGGNIRVQRALNKRKPIGFSSAIFDLSNVIAVKRICGCHLGESSPLSLRTSCSSIPES